MTKNADIDQYKYSGYGIEFDRKNEFSFGDGYGKNIIIFGANMNSSVRVDKKKKIFKFSVKVLHRDWMALH